MVVSLKLYNTKVIHKSQLLVDAGIFSITEDVAIGFRKMIEADIAAGKITLT
jgi:hypothetical protein